MLGVATDGAAANPAAARCPFAGLLGVGTTGFPVDAAKEAYAKAGGPAANAKALQQPPQFSAPSSCKPDEYRAYAQAVAAAIRNGTLEAPKAARLAFHAAFTYSPSSSLGGPNGAWIDFPQEISWAANAGLDEPLAAVKALKGAHACISLADAIAFAGVVAVEVAGGPAIAFIPGRRDALSHDAATGAIALAARMPDGAFNAPAVAASFALAGLSARDAVALVGGGHSLGGMDAAASGWSGAFTPAGDSWPEPKNRYFVDLTALEWEPTTVAGTGRVQFVPKPGQAKALYATSDGTLVARLPSDMALLEHPAFAELSRMYARDEAAFVSDFARAYQRMLQLGAGEGGAWTLQPEKFVWLGLSGNATSYGVAIAPM
jgi:catalase (peroxidase I)